MLQPLGDHLFVMSLEPLKALQKQDANLLFEAQLGAGRVFGVW